MSTFREDAENVYNRDQLLKTYAMLDANSATAKILWEEVGRLSSIIEINTTLTALSKGRLLADNETPFTTDVTAVPGISRAHQLKAIGNGVCPQQAVAAYSSLLELEVSS